jgi:hypothetical protein
MPQGDPCPLDAEALAVEFRKGHRVTLASDGRWFDVEVDGRLILNLSDWFLGAGELGATFLPPGNRLGLPDAPLRTVRVRAFLTEEAGRYDAAAEHDRIAMLTADVLPHPGNGAWWHLLATGPRAFVFLQDVGSPALVTLAGAETFVRVGGATTAVAAWAVRPGLASQSLHHSQGALGGFLRRMKGPLGIQAALTATAHKLARIVYLALKHGMTYVRQSQEEYEAQMKEKQIKALRRKARQLGLEVIEKTSGTVATAVAASVDG